MSKTCPDCYFQSHSVRSGVQRTVGVAELPKRQGRSTGKKWQLMSIERGHTEAGGGDLGDKMGDMGETRGFWPLSPPAKLDKKTREFFSTESEFRAKFME